MYTSIKKISKIPIFFIHNPTESDITLSVRHQSESESAMIVHLIDLYQKSVDSIIGIENGLIEELDTFNIVDLKSFFVRYPSAWYELKRKLHSMHGLYKGKIPKEAEEKMLSVFLRLGRVEINPDSIEHIWRKEILENRALTTSVSREPSLLDSSHGMLSYLSLREQKDQIAFIRKIIEAGIRSNLDKDLHGEHDGGKDGFPTFFKKLLPHILFYLNDIFHIEVPQDVGGNIESVSKWVVSQIWGNQHTGVGAKNAWMLVKAFRAWGGFEAIMTQYEEAKESVKHIPKKLQSHGIPFEYEGSRLEKSFQDTIEVHYGSADIILSSGKSVKIGIEYRAKSLKSILLKMWENEDYNNIDANRDTIGLALIWDDKILESEKVELFAAFSTIFADKGYILKDKGAFEKEELSLLRSKLKAGEKRPLGTIVSEKKKKSSKLFKNISYSGFTKIVDTNTGIEVQGFDRSAYEYWKSEHYEFDPLKIMSAWSRGSWFLTPVQTLNTVRDNIDRDILESKLQKRPQDIIWDYIQDGRILPYLGSNSELYLVPKQHETNFEQKFAKASLMQKGDKALKAFINTLSSQSSHASASQPPSRDQSGPTFAKKGEATPSK